MAIKNERPDLRLHGFGLKTTALADPLVRSMLWSADSMAWSFAAAASAQPERLARGDSLGRKHHFAASAVAALDRCSMTGWIKLETKLRRHPKVVSMAAALKSDRNRVLGGLFSVWCVFDEHSPDGLLPAYTLRTMDEEVGWKGFSAAMSGVGWLIETPAGLEAPDYAEHNGPTAKRRALDAKRKAEERDADKVPQKGGGESGDLSASQADKTQTREREEKRRGELSEESAVESGEAVSAPGAVCRALRTAGIAAVSPDHPRLLALLAAGATPGEFTDAARSGIGKANGFAYVLGVVEGRRRDAATSTKGIHRGPLPTPKSTNSERHAATAQGLTGRNRTHGNEPDHDIVDVQARAVG
jgi:hypothetical protein